MATDRSRYAARGVSSGKEDVHRAIEPLERGLFPGAFCTIFPDIAGDPAFGSIQHVDGAGTKSSLAYMASLEGFDSSVWEGIAQDSLVMNVDDLACVGAVGRMHVSQIIGRNKFLIPAEAVEAIIIGCKRFCDKMREFGFDLVYVGGETADLPDLVRTVTVDNSVSTRVRLTEVIDASRMVPGDVIIGFSSTGQARWENRPNSGIGSNGLTNARHDALSNYYTAVPESHSPQVPKTLVYRGDYRLGDPLPGDSHFTIGSALLSPTRTYLPLIRRLLELAPVGQIHGLIHCSGGGQTKIGKFGGPGNRYVKDYCFFVPPLFAMLQDRSGLSWKEMFAVYNMGHRLEAVVPESAEWACFAAATWAGIEARRVGQVERSSSGKNEVVIVVPEGTFTY
ncbi:phosphoribosylformylglycinamidine cyclo-ligase [Candidatus Kaiserbacteria bacterium]|nr:phosphoribosylformylglycinamidine cyclo-ligase [Candidatus Kaiserbacteria bacterium]